MKEANLTEVQELLKAECGKEKKGGEKKTGRNEQLSNVPDTVLFVAMCSLSKSS